VGCKFAVGLGCLRIERRQEDLGLEAGALGPELRTDEAMLKLVLLKVRFDWILIVGSKPWVHSMRYRMPRGLLPRNLEVAACGRTDSSVRVDGGVPIRGAARAGLDHSGRRGGSTVAAGQAESSSGARGRVRRARCARCRRPWVLALASWVRAALKPPPAPRQLRVDVGGSGVAGSAGREAAGGGE